MAKSSLVLCFLLNLALVSPAGAWGFHPGNPDRPHDRFHDRSHGHPRGAPGPDVDIGLIGLAMVGVATVVALRRKGKS